MRHAGGGPLHVVFASTEPENATPPTPLRVPDATKSLDRQYDTTGYSDPWTPQDNAAIGTAAARILPISILPARLLLSQMQLAFVSRTPELAAVAAQLKTDLEARYPALELAAGGPPITLPSLSNVREGAAEGAKGGGAPHSPPLPSQVTTFFNSESALESFITSASYNDPGTLKVCLRCRHEFVRGGLVESSRRPPPPAFRSGPPSSSTARRPPSTTRSA